MMDRMAQHGRYGDSMLVHMNPVEVAGIAAMSPTGRLTTNPVTGQPEAFLPLLFGGLGSLLKLTPLMTGALTGIGTAAVATQAKISSEEAPTMNKRGGLVKKLVKKKRRGYRSV